MLNTFREWTNADDARAGGIADVFASAYMMPLGILPRMRLLAFGWEKPGDTLRQPTDRAWWSKRYTSGGFAPRKLWEPLSTYVDKVVPNTTPHFPEDVAAMDATALARQRNATASELEDIQRVKADICAPFIIPARRGVVPTPETVCIARIEAARQGDKSKPLIPSRPGLPWWVIAGIAILVSKSLRNR